MKQEPLFLKPVFHEKIWGGRNLKTDFGYDIPEGKIGECWAISGHPHGVSVVTNGQFAGQNLADLFHDQPILFGHPTGDRFPLLTKILDANGKLSVQVHPADDYAMAHENELGKTECWYVLKAKPGAYLIYGHKAKTKEELEKLIDEEKWNQLLGKLTVKTGDFVYVPSGTIHALTEGIEVLETQQSSDVTYRLYDYDRTDDQGNKRELHLGPAKDVITVPFKLPKLHQKTEQVANSTITTLVTAPDSPYFTVKKLTIFGDLPQTRNEVPFTLCSVVAGDGQITVGDQTYNLKRGTHFILPNNVQTWTWHGKMVVIISYPNEGKY